MQFSDFARKLKGVIGGKSSAAAFTKTLFEVMLVEDETLAEDEKVLSEYSKETFKAYFSGNTFRLCERRDFFHDARACRNHFRSV